MIKYNEEHKQGVKGLNKEQSLMPNVKPILPNPIEKGKMQQTEISKHQESVYADLLKHTPPISDVLYKPASSLTHKELRDAIFHCQTGARTTAAEKDQYDAVIQGAFDYLYGKEPVRYDAVLTC